MYPEEQQAGYKFLQQLTPTSVTHITNNSVLIRLGLARGINYGASQPARYGNTYDNKLLPLVRMQVLYCKPAMGLYHSHTIVDMGPYHCIITTTDATSVCSGLHLWNGERMTAWVGVY